MLTAILIDDEERNLSTLQNNLEKYCPEVKIKAACDSAKEGMKAINKYKPDVVFLDIQMPHMNGFEMLECLGVINFNVIFVTAFSEYAVQAFRLSAVDYLMKPVSKDQLQEAVEKVLKKKEKNLPQEQLEVLINNIKNPSDPFRKIGFHANKGVEFLLVNDILYCKADGNFTWIHLSEKKPMFSLESLKEISEKKLKELPFCRIHNSHLININHANRYVKGDGGYVIMDNGEKLNVARGKKDLLLKMIAG